MEFCPCGTHKPYQTCCGLFIDETALPATPEQLMRSRYTAYATGNINYIAKTMRGPASKNFDPENAKIWADQVTWLSLKVLKTNFHLDKGFVEFIASYEDNGKKQKIHELSQFSLINGRWYYTMGKNHK